MFAPGDVVVCVEGHGKFLRRGAFYTVKEVYENLGRQSVRLKETNQSGWFAFRFELAFDEGKSDL